MSSKQLSALLKPLVLFTCFILSNCIHAQVEYNWQNSKEGWVSSNDPGKQCNLNSQNESMAMCSFHLYPVMRS